MGNCKSYSKCKPKLASTRGTFMNATEIKGMFPKDMKIIDFGRAGFIRIDIPKRSKVTVLHYPNENEPLTEQTSTYYDPAFISIIYYKSKEASLNVNTGNGKNGAYLYSTRWFIKIRQM